MKPHAICKGGSVFWRGSNPAFRYLPLSDATDLRDAFASRANGGDRGLPGYADMCRAYAKDLTRAIDRTTQKLLQEQRAKEKTHEPA